MVCGLTHHSQRLNLIVLAAGSSFIEIFVIYVEFGCLSIAQGVQLKRNPKTGVENKKVLIQWLN